jgi:hypothetical protein
VSEYDALDAMVERMAREEQEGLDRARGQFILDVVAAEDRRKHAGDPLIEAISRAHQAKAGADQ